MHIGVSVLHWLYEPLHLHPLLFFIRSLSIEISLNVVLNPVFTDKKKAENRQGLEKCNGLYIKGVDVVNFDQITPDYFLYKC